MGFKDYIWAADLAEMKELCSKYKNVKFFYVSWMFSLNMHGLNFTEIKKVKKYFIEIVNESNSKRNEYGLIKEENFAINLFKNG